jgi:hypothetical protein
MAQKRLSPKGFKNSHYYQELGLKYPGDASAQMLDEQHDRRQRTERTPRVVFF